MSRTLHRRTLNLVDQLLARGRRLHEMGLFPQAVRLLHKITTLQQLPVAAAEEIQSLLADIQFRQGQFHRARRHLRAALAHQPVSADYHHRLALATDEDPQGNADQALTQYRRCLKLDPKNPHYWCDFGFALLNNEDAEGGLKALRKANRLAPDDPEILALVVRGLNGEGGEAEACQLLRAARFRNPRDGRFCSLWQRFQFDLLWERQQKTPPLPPAAEDKRQAVLPFALRQKEMKLGGRTIRFDGPATLKGPASRSPRRSRPSKKK